MTGKYNNLTQAQLVELLEKRDRTKKLGLVWERDEIEADAAVDANFIACRIDEALSDKPAPWDNLVIEGDNFDALRWLRMTHAGRVKCIYIDPPYNTGNKDWVYNDSYMNNEDRFRQSTWLEFLYRRLTLARDLLAENGVLLASINDDQRAILEMLMNEAMPGMRLGSLVWRTRDTTSAKGGNFSDVHEHVLVYAKPNFIFRGSDKSQKKYKNPDNDPRGIWNTDPLTLAFDRGDRENLYYPLHDPNTDIWYPCDPDRVWAYASKERLKEGQKTRALPMEDQIKDNLVVFPSEQKVVIWETLEDVLEAIRTGDVPVTPRDKKPLIREDTDPEFWVGRKVGFNRPGYKKFWTELRSHVSPLSSWIARMNEDEIGGLWTLRTGSGGAGTNEIQSIFGSKAFQNPKPKALIKQLVYQCTAPDDLVLDFFAGSGTTAHAVMELNAEDGGSRKFIMVSSTEATEDDPEKNLCRDVTAERIRLLNASDDERFANLVAGFAYLRTHDIAFEDLDYDLKPAEAWAALEAMHDLPLTLYVPDAAWNLHEGETTALVLVDRFDPGLLQWLQGRDRQNLFVYAWAPGQIAQHLDGTHVDIRPVRDTLVKRFQQ
ncbi:site-specific DNA-methyltransferase [Altererythrobacter sp.]|nr:site-specific DNA-methyltransferase [Altererythrobacter sp.]